MSFRRTYGKDTGEDIREGYEPTDDVAAVDPKEDEGDEFTVGDDEEGQTPQDESEESMHWKQAREPAVVMKPRYGLDGEEAFENVWSGEEPSQPPHENP